MSDDLTSAIRQACNDPGRLDTLYSYGILDTPPETVFDDIAQLAAEVCQSPAALVNFIDSDRQFWKAAVGVQGPEPPLADSICAHTLIGEGLVIVPDLAADPRFREHPLVVSAPKLRFYAGVALNDANGHKLGSLCVLGPEPRQLTVGQKQSLRTLARQVMSQLELRRVAVRQALDAAELDRLASELNEVQSRLEATLAAAEVGTWTWDIVANRVVGDRNLARLFGRPIERPSGELSAFIESIHSDDRDRVQRQIAATLASGTHFESDYRLVLPNGETRRVLARGKVERDPAGAPLRMPGVVLDITERVAAEEARREAAEQLARQSREASAILSSVRDIVYIFDRQGRFLFANQTLLDLWGLTADEARGKSMPELGYPPDVSAYLLDHIETVFNAKQRVRGEVKYVSPTGVDGIYEHIFAPILSADGAVEAVAGTTRDVTEQRQSAKALRASESRFRFLSLLGDMTRQLADPEQVMETVAQALGEYLQADRCAYATVEADSDAFTIVHDYSPQLPSSVGSFRLAQFGPRAVQDLLRATTLVLRDVDRELQPADGADTFNSIGIKAIICCPLVKHGRLAAMMAVHSAQPRDWTADEISLVEAVVERSWAYIERASTARALQQSEAAFRMIADSMPQIVWVTRPDGYHEYYNKRWFDFLGLDYEATCGDQWVVALHPDDAERSRERWRQSLESGDVYEIEYRIRRHDGQYRWFLGRALPLRDESGAINKWYGTCTDIHDQRELMQQRDELLKSEQLARGEAERSGRMKDEFLATLSHELRTPLNAILGWAQILRQHEIPPEDLAQGLETIERNARAQTQIIEDLLDMSRIISGKVRLDVQRMDIAPVLQAAVDTLRPAADAKGIRVRAVLDPSAGPISGDPNRLQQIFWNLLSNAIKFTPKGGQVQVLLERVNSHLEVRVTDTGEGIGADFLPHVFDRFRQADSTTTRRHGGLGLGLAIVKQLIELHGGTIHVASPGIGQGATFTAKLPLSILHATDDSTAERRHPAAGATSYRLVDECSQLKSVRVLVVDDEPDARNLVKRVLEECDAVVVTAGSADEAIKLLQAHPVDVLVSDIGMPGEDGYSLIRRVRALPADMGGGAPALALTAYARSEDRVRSILAGFQMHIAKPVEPSELIAMVASLAGRTPTN